MEQKRIKVRLTENSPYSDYGYYEKGDIGYIDGYVNDNAVIILENGKFAKADLRWIEVVNEEDKNVNTELKESEDERIRKALIKYFKNFDSESLYTVGLNEEDTLAWLEKQGEQKPADKIEPKFKVGQTIIYKGTENIAPTKMTISDIANGQYWDDNCCIAPISDQDNWELVEQKPTGWSEEDEKQLQHAMLALQWYAGGTDITNWLLSIKERVQPHSQWKPSDEQMDALEHFVRSIGESGFACPYDNNTKLLYLLLSDLKKLKA